MKDRHALYQSHGFTDTLLQVMSDNYSHKRNGSTGREKAETQVAKRGIPKFRRGMNYNEDYYLLVDEDEAEFGKILKSKGISFEWSSLKQKKIPDLLISCHGMTYIVEHKHKKEGGGGQSSQDVEVVDFIRYTENGVSFVTYLDGPYFNRLARGGSDKEEALKDDIGRSLSLNKNNYFVNTAGFERFLDEVVVGDNSPSAPRTLANFFGD